MLALAGGCGGNGAEAESDGVAVVRQCEEALNRNDNAAAGDLLADGAVVYGEPVPTGGGDSAVRGLNCEAEIESIAQRGETVTAPAVRTQLELYVHVWQATRAGITAIVEPPDAA